MKSQSTKGSTAPTSGSLNAVEQIRRMRGGAQSHLMRCLDGTYYFVRKESHLPYRAQMIDRGFCFRGYIEKFNALQATYDRWRVYENVRSIDTFEPWLTLVEQIDEESLATAGMRNS